MTSSIIEFKVGDVVEFKDPIYDKSCKYYFINNINTSSDEKFLTLIARESLERLTFINEKLVKLSDSQTRLCSGDKVKIRGLNQEFIIIRFETNYLEIITEDLSKKFKVDSSILEKI